MKQNLDTLKSEILEQLGAQGFAVFHSYSRNLEDTGTIYWDVHHYPDFRPFLDTARQLGVKMVTFHHREFTREAVEDAFDRLEECEISPEERRSYERRLREMGGYEGFTCAVELAYDFETQVYLYSLQTAWYTEFLDLLDEIDGYTSDEEAEDEGPIGGYFSKN